MSEPLPLFASPLANILCRLKLAPLLVTLGLSFILAGCGKNSSGPSSASEPKGSPNSQTAPPLESALAAWRQGDKAAAVARFVETDWSARPLFTPGSVLTLSEEQFKNLPAGERQSKSGEIVSASGELKQLAAAVAESGRQAAANKDTAQARKLFASVKQCGEALESPQSLALVRLVGTAMKKMADTELAKLP